MIEEIVLTLRSKSHIMIHIKEILKERGITQAELAQRLGVHRVALNSTLNNPNIKLSTIEKIADAIGCDVSEFFAKKGTELVCPHCGQPISIEVK